MKRNILLSVFIVFTVAMLSLIGGPVEARATKLTFPTSRAHNLERQDWVTFSLGLWVKEVEEASGGKVKIRELVGAAPDQDLYEMVASGGADLSFLTVMYNPGNFPITESMTVPSIGTVCQRPSRVAWEFWKTHPELNKEYGKVKLLALFATGTAPPGISLVTVDKPVHSLADLQGMKIGTYGEWGIKMVKILGAAPVPVPPPESYESPAEKNCRRQLYGRCYVGSP